MTLPDESRESEESRELAAAAALFEEIVELPESARPARLRAIVDSGVASRVRRWLDADRVPDAAVGDPLRAAAGWLAEDAPENPASVDRRGERIGPWRVLEPIGHGGMGEVFLAERADGSFERRVALKILRSGLDSADIVARFMAERRILARLDHPGIAQLIDGGLAGDGRPYFALELVSGRPITEWCAEHRLGVEARLRLLLQVVAAVDFAHRSLVVHRDLKPSNVWVGAGGQVKLLDFGIAKLLSDDGSDETRTGAQLLTPRYAAPEQLAGEPVTTATDVHALGLLLWELLTGEPARRATPIGELPNFERLERETRVPPSARALQDAQPARAPLDDDSPRARQRLARQLAGDLDKVTLRALRREPGRRYPSAAAFGDDLQRFLENRPVAARDGALTYRAGKFVRRHRAAVLAATLVALSLVGGVVATWRQSRIAMLERARAERRFADVRRLANVALFDVHASLDRVSGAMPTRRLLVDTALTYLDDLAREAGDEPELLAELAAAYEKTAEIQGMPEWPSEGRTGDALASLERGLALRRRIRESAGRASGREQRAGTGPDDLAEARLLTRIGSVLAARGEIVAALARHREGLAFYEAHAAFDGATVRPEQVEAYVAVGDDLWQLGDLPGAVAQYRRARVEALAIRERAPDSAPALRHLGVIAQRLGDASAESGAWNEALVGHSESLAVDRELAARSPHDAEIRRDLGTDLSRLGVDYASLGRYPEAIERHREASALREALLLENPGDARSLDDAAESRLELGKVLIRLADLRGAAQAIRAAIERRRELAQRDAGNAQWQIGLAEGLSALFAVETARGDAESASRIRREEIAIRRRLAAVSPDLATNLAALDRLQAAVETTPNPGN